MAVWETLSQTKWWQIAHFRAAIQISKNTRNTNRIIAGNKYVWTVERFFKCAKKALSCEKRAKLPFFNFSRRFSDLLRGKCFLIKNEFSQYIIRITRGKGAHYLWTSLIFTCSGCSLPRKNRKSSKCNTFKSIAPADHVWFLTLPINSLRYFCYICSLFTAPFPPCHFQALLNLLLLQ